MGEILEIVTAVCVGGALLFFTVGVWLIGIATVAHWVLY